MGELNFTGIMLISGLVLMLPLQVLLCCKCRSLLLRLLPVGLFLLVGLTFWLLGVTTTGLNVLFYMIYAVYAGAMLLLCGLGWGIWALIRLVKRSRQHRK